MRETTARRIVLALLRRTRHGRLVVREGGRRHEFGPERAALSARVDVHSPAVWPALLRGSNGLAETYADGLWDCDDAVALVRIAALNARAFDRLRELFAPAIVPWQRIARLVPRNTRAGSRRNIAAHYDLGNELFSLFLDPTMMYSCAIFESPRATLEEAQLAKLDRICRALRLTPADHLLEIGTGWGGLALHAAREHGCRVTTTTISREQHDHALARVREAGLEDRVTVLLCDYRDLRGRFDKLVSVEMIEAVGWQYFDDYFERCSALLEPDGLMLLQAITIDDRAYEAEKAARSFINTEIFPGGCLPSLEVIDRCVARRTDMTAVGLERLGDHYAETLRRWRGAFVANAERAGRLGYDLRFRRMWELYLSYCEAGFRERRIDDVQLLLAKPVWRAVGSAVAIAAPARTEAAA